MSKPISLNGEFVTLRPLALDDAEKTFVWRHTQRAHNLNKGAETLEAQRAWILSRPNSEYNFIIELKDGAAVGMLSLVDVDIRNRRAESGRFLIGEEDAVRGIPVAVEAMKLLYEFAFDVLGLVRIYGTIGSNNMPMHKWQTFLGMKEEGRLRRHYFIDGDFQDAICMGLLEDEYRKITLPRMRTLLAAGRENQIPKNNPDRL
jgi:[ribosomal protein S5]-alanine N-acetyltransferase